MRPMKDLRRQLPREYAWLLQHDHVWLKNNTPKAQRRGRSSLSVDWCKRDAEYTAGVREAALNLRNVTGRPVRVTKTAIGRAIGAVPLLQQKLHKMPLTAQILSAVVETQEQYAVRRVEWAVNQYCQEHILPRRWQFIARANIYSLRENSAIKCAIEGALSMLRSKFSDNYVERAAS